MNDDARPDVEPVEKALERLGVNAVFGEPVRQGDVTVIPVAEVRFGFGYGYGSGRQRSKAEEDDPRTDEGSGGGSGTAGRASPRGYVRISPEGVHFEPVLDVTRIALAGIAFAAWTAFWIIRALRDAGRER